jgi:hypothetical protein
LKSEGETVLSENHWAKLEEVNPKLKVVTRVAKVKIRDLNINLLQRNYSSTDPPVNLRSGKGMLSCTLQLLKKHDIDQKLHYNS